MFRHVPNALTFSRLILAAVFFVMLSYYQYEGRGDRTFLNVAFIIYVIALGTDFLDGYLARRWKVEGQFGRIVDPFVDKILVLGSFIFFAGKNFVIPDTHARRRAFIRRENHHGRCAGNRPDSARRANLLVTILRNLHESGGKSFGAAFSGS